MEASPDISALIAGLNDRSPYLRQKAAKRLAGCAEQAAAAADQVVPALKQALTDENKYVRLAAAVAMARIAPKKPESIRTLAGLLSDEHRDIRASAAVALGELGPLAKAAEGKLRQAAADDQELVRRSAAEALERIVPP